MKLRDWADNQGLNYLQAWRMHKNGKIPGSHKNNNGEIIVPNSTEPVDTKGVSIAALKNDMAGEPYAVEIASTRTNRSANIKPTDRFKHIDDVPTPFNYSTAGYGNSDVSCRDQVILCQKAYFGFSIFRTTIDLMTEFSVNNIHFKGGSQKSRSFFEAYLKKIGFWKFQDMWFREYYRSGNVFVYRIEGEIKDEDIKLLQQTFGIEKATIKGEIPIRFVILNPADINATGSVSFVNTTYYKVLSDYELERLRNPKTPEDDEVLKQLDPETQKLIKNKKSGIVYLPLNNKNIVATFYKKQDYEAFGVPLGYPVLEDINFKKELRLMDQAIARTAQQAILLITMGAEPDKGGINQKNLAAMARLFENESVARVVIADYTTEATFVIPEIASILDPKKYEILDKDIAIGLNNVLLGAGEKYANQHEKIEIFVERLKHARQAFLNEFLIPEIKRIAKNIGLKNFPEPYFEDIDLKDELEWAKIYTKMMEIGVLTAEEGFAAIETGKLPSPENSVESQQKFKENRDKGLYKPIVGGPKEGDGAGRPSGSKAPQTTKKISPIGASFSLTKIKDNLLLAQKLQTEVTNSLKTKFKLENLSESQAKIAEEISDVIIANEESNSWLNKINEYLDNPIDKNPEQVKKTNEIAAEFGVDSYLASILNHSKI